jgi:hypothetical protein
MSDTTKTSKRPPTVPHPDVFDWREGDGVAFLDDKAHARVGAALNGARTIAAILMQHNLDRDNDEGQEAGLRLREHTTHGLFEALACCLETAEQHTVLNGGTWTTTMSADDPEAGHLRKAAHDARLMRDARIEAARVKYRTEQAARAAGRGAA